MSHRFRAFRAFRAGAACCALAAAVVVAFPLLVDCGSEASSTFDSGPCGTVYAGKCGTPCTTDESCPIGLHCGADQKCTAECADNSSCPPGQTCSSRGQCGVGNPISPFGDDSGPPAAGDGGETTDAACVDVNLTLAKLVPTVMLMVDQSGSMTSSFGDAGGTRWTVLRDLLMNPDGGLVKTLENDVRWGLALFTWDGKHNISTCPEVTTVAVAIDNYNAMNTVYQAANPIDNTPTGDSLLKVAGIVDGGIVDGGFVTMPSDGPKVIIIATDGDPDSCASKGTNDQASQNFTVAAAAAVYDAGVKVYDIAVSSTLNATKQQQVANAGVGLDPDKGDAAVYRADDPATLINAFDAIITSTRSCIFKLNGTVVAGQESKGTVTLNGVPLVYNAPDGWKLDDPSTLEVTGTACATVKTTADATLTATFPCGAAQVNPGGPIK
jgi:hypothetical protein